MRLVCYLRLIVITWDDIGNDCINYDPVVTLDRSIRTRYQDTNIKYGNDNE